MYLFKVTFYNKDLLEDIEEAIQIDTAGVDMTEREVYILAMEKAYDKSVEMGKEWGLGSVEFIAC